jgi:Flp pilus assembly pilin Flp
MTFIAIAVVVTISQLGGTVGTVHERVQNIFVN